MTPEQRRDYVRDGYVRIPHAITAEHVAQLNRDFDSRLRHELALAKDFSSTSGFVDGFRKFQFAGGLLQPAVQRRSGHDYRNDREISYAAPPGWGELVQPVGAQSTAAFRALIEPPAVATVLAELLEQPQYGHVSPAVPLADRPRWRLDHDNMHYKAGYRDNGDLSPPGDGSLHGDISNHHITAIYELVDVGPGDGGFCRIRGSHRPDFRFDDGADLPTRDQTDPQWREPIAGEWPPELGVVRVEGQAGECIVFSEKLKHATVPWTGQGERRTVFMKYSPYGYHHGDVGYDIKDCGLSEHQRQRLSFPERWIDVDKRAKKQQAYAARHGPDEWPVSVTEMQENTGPTAEAARL